MLSYFLYNSVIVTWCIQKRVGHGWWDKQISYFYFDEQSEKILQEF